MKILTVTSESMEDAQAYIQSGADEVILALKDGCFTSLHEFTLNEIQRISQSYTGRTVVLMNRLFGEEEKEWAQQMLEKVLAISDAVLFADPLLLFEATKLQQQNKMIYRPETLMTSDKDACWWMSQGLQSIQISPLLTKEEIVKIAQAVSSSSLQIHGRLLMSVSKRPLLDAYSQIHHLPSLQGQRDLYLKEESREGKMPIYENAYGTYIYTDYMQESFACMHSFIAAGITRFEIDSNGLTQQQVKDAIVIYRHQLDGIDEDGAGYLTKYQALPFSSGYYEQKTVK